MRRVIKKLPKPQTLTTNYSKEDINIFFAHHFGNPYKLLNARF